VTGAPAPIAGFWIRVLADLLDAVFLGVLGWLLSLLLRGLLLRLGERAVIIGLATSLVYAGVLQSHLGGGQTLAKRLLRLRVVRLDGTPLSIGRALLRYATVSFPLYQGAISLAAVTLLPFVRIESAQVVQGTLALVLFLGCVAVVPFHPLRRGLHDLLTGTIVVRGGMPARATLADARNDVCDRTIVNGAAALLVVSVAISLALARPASLLPASIRHPEALVPALPLQNARITDTLELEKNARIRTLVVAAFLPTSAPSAPDLAAAHAAIAAALRAQLPAHSDVTRIGSTLRTGINLGIYSDYQTSTQLEDRTRAAP
jgi:uncharacterized RDD family membrane protein YckC